MRAVLPICRAKGIRIITNMGAANPVAAARKTAEVAQSLGLSPLRIAAVIGDDVLDACKAAICPIMEIDGRSAARQPAALGQCLSRRRADRGGAAGGAEVVITGRAADPAMFLAPQIHAFGWSMEDWSRLGRGTVAGHLLECAGQITGGYFADPGYKDVPIWRASAFPSAKSARTAGGDHQGAGLGRHGHGGDLQGAAALRGARPARYLQPDVVGRFLASDGRGDRARSRPHQRRARHRGPAR